NHSGGVVSSDLAYRVYSFVVVAHAKQQDRCNGRKRKLEFRDATGLRLIHLGRWLSKRCERGYRKQRNCENNDRPTFPYPRQEPETGHKGPDNAARHIDGVGRSGSIGIAW